MRGQTKGPLAVSSPLALLRSRTEEAARLGIFGAPSFVVAGELFWRNDRLEDALAWERG